jgi:endonuclease/exonuclease/phosphatase (EEP) superfamily protein YafD
MYTKFNSFVLFCFAYLQLQLFLARDWWFFELFTHYAHYYVLPGLFFALLAIFKRHWKSALFFLVFTSIQLGTLDPYLHSFPPLNEPAELTLLASNFYYENAHFEEFTALLNEEQPDLFMIHEAGPQWTDGIENFTADYPYTALTEELGIHGIAMGSQIPGTFKEIPLGTKFGLEFTPEDGSYHVLAVHPLAPITAPYAAERNQQFKDIATYVLSSKVPVVVMGDFNCTPWTPYLTDLLENAELRDARVGFGLLPTWNTHSALFKLPIDHALLHGPWEVVDFYAADAIPHSDHRPIVVELAF